MANWKKIILKDDNAELAQVTASVGVNIATVPLGVSGSSGDNVVVVDSSGNIKSILQSSVQGTNTEYDADGTTIQLSNSTFSVIPGGINHDSLSGFLASEHIAWDTASAGNVIHATNYTDTTYAAGTGILNADANNTFSVNPLQPGITQVGNLTTGSIGGNFGAIITTGIVSASTITTSTFSAPILNVTNITASGTLTANNITAATVDITGSLTVTGSLIYNSETFADAVASQGTGSTLWGSSETNSHYFSGSVTASGDVNAATFTGVGGNITGISNTNVNTADLTAGNGFTLTGTPYSGDAAGGLALLTNGPTLGLSASGLKIADGQVTAVQLGQQSVTSTKIANQAVTHDKLNIDLISAATTNPSSIVNGTDHILMASGSSQNNLVKTPLSAISTYVNTTLSGSYSNNAGTVISVTGASDVDNLTLGSAEGTAGHVTMSLSGTLSIDNANWSGAALATGSGGTGATTAATAASTLLNTSQGGNLTIGTVDDTITIPGNLDINGTLTSIDSVNLEISDRFIHIGSGSSTSGEDIGIQFGEQASAGNLLLWDSQYNVSSSAGTNVGRFGVGYNQLATSGLIDSADGGAVDVTAAYHLAAVISGSGNNSYETQIGNIRLSAGAAWIYA